MLGEPCRSPRLLCRPDDRDQLPSAPDFRAGLLIGQHFGSHRAHLGPGSALHILANAARPGCIQHIDGVIDHHWSPNAQPRRKRPACLGCLNSRPRPAGPSQCATFPHLASPPSPLHDVVIPRSPAVGWAAPHPTPFETRCRKSPKLHTVRRRHRRAAQRRLSRKLVRSTHKPPYLPLHRWSRND